MKQIIVHVKVEPGKFQTLQQHIHSQKRSKIEKGTVWLLQKASLIGTNADKWAQAMLKARGIPGTGRSYRLKGRTGNNSTKKDKDNNDITRKKSKPD